MHDQDTYGRHATDTKRLERKALTHDKDQKRTDQCKQPIPDKRKKTVTLRIPR